jgi:hypothetical protein
VHPGDDHFDGELPMSGQRVLALVILLVVGVFSLPLSAYLLDGPGTENWILPVALLACALVGAAVGRTLPGLAGPTASPIRAATVGAAAGIGMALAGVLLFFFLLSGFSGA